MRVGSDHFHGYTNSNIIILISKLMLVIILTIVAAIYKELSTCLLDTVLSAFMVLITRVHYFYS